MTAFRMGHGQSPDWRQAVMACAEAIGRPTGANLGFVYVADSLAGDFSGIVAELRTRTGVDTWVGTVGIGVCATGMEYFAEPAVVAMVGTFPPASFRPFGAGAPPEGTSPFGIVHADPRQRDCIDAVGALAAATGGFLVGGLSSSRGTYHTIAGEDATGTISGVLFGEGVAVATGLSQGCSAIGRKRTVTSAQDTMILTIDGMPAVEALARDMAEAGITGEKGAADGLHVAFPIAGSDTGDFVVRNLMGVDPDTGAIAVAEHVSEGDVIQFCRRSAAAAREDLGRMLGGLARRASQPKGALYFTCLARGPNLFAERSEELRVIRDALGDVPLVGFFGNGEISGGRLYTYTGVLAVFL